MRQTGKSVFSNIGMHRVITFLLVPDLDGLIGRARQEPRGVGRRADAVHNTCVRFDIPRRRSLREIPDPNFTIATSGYHRVQAVWMFGHRVHTVDVATQGSQERFGEQSFGFDCIQCTNIFSCLFKGMNCRIEIPLYFMNILSSLTDVVI